MSTDQAAMDGVVLAILLWSALVGVAAGSWRLLIWALDRHRETQWERELLALADGHGGRADHQP